jgi:hypothetical protein
VYKPCKAEICCSSPFSAITLTCISPAQPHNLP